ncbi:hypothetical protein ABZX85_18745 [Streptomyces sp. NPDC004539]|uniref:hypothetical protein n=1 Tax=Streptomyces sp. NPDC004539 TaxID=3154280 RepID=UPI0033B282F9
MDRAVGPGGVEGLSKLYLKDRTVMALVQAASEDGVRAAALLTSDPEDLGPLRGPAVEILKI